ncbi:MAG: hypothetical protein GWO02_19395 [Gammaproteobacteria bacterium]|nr:hypothetical protein [Gammaproteobacteria bacterium]
MSARLPLLAVVCVGAALLGACASVPNHRVHQTLLEGRASAPERMVLLPVDIEVSEISAGGVEEEVPAWSEAATENVERALQGYAAGRDSMSLVEAPTLSREERRRVEEHLALYDVVGGNAFRYTNLPVAAWRHKIREFDYTLGSGLAFLREKTGAEAAVVVIGSDQISSSGRKALMVVGAVAGVEVQKGTSFLSAGVIDLRTGNLLWLNYAADYGGRDLRKAEDATAMVNGMLSSYPGVEAFDVAEVGR